MRGEERGQKVFSSWCAPVIFPIMARQPRSAPGGLAHHAMNRASGKIELFEDAGTHEAFPRMLAEALQRQRSARACRALAMEPCLGTGQHNDDLIMHQRLAQWPIRGPGNWTEPLNTPPKETELAATRGSKNLGRPHGDEAGMVRTAIKLGAESSPRPIGRPTKETTSEKIF